MVAAPFGALIEQAIMAKLTCLLADWLTRDGYAPRLPRPVRDFLSTQLRAGRHRWRLHHRETARVIAALDDRGIPAAAINGIAVASLLYDGRGTRQYTDADVLIPAGTTDTATRILAGLGYAPTGRPGALRRDLGDPVVPSLNVDLTSRLAHAGAPAAASEALARRAPAPACADAPEPLPVLARSDGFAHALARLAFRPRWTGRADALRYALTSVAVPAACAPSLPLAAAAGWEQVLRCWPELPARPPLTIPAPPETP